MRMTRMTALKACWKGRRSFSESMVGIGTEGGRGPWEEAHPMRTTGLSISVSKPYIHRCELKSMTIGNDPIPRPRGIYTSVQLGPRMLTDEVNIRRGTVTNHSGHRLAVECDTGLQLHICLHIWWSARDGYLCSDAKRTVLQILVAPFFISSHLSHPCALFSTEYQKTTKLFAVVGNPNSLIWDKMKASIVTLFEGAWTLLNITT